DKLDVTKSSSANAIVTVTNGTIAAVNDAGTQNGTTGGTAITSVLSNDTYNDVANAGVASAANITITQNNNNSNGKVTLNTTTGEVTVAANTPVGTYTMVLQTRVWLRQQILPLPKIITIAMVRLL
ncbi:hypothetical protein DRW42_28185, partial [Pedobacter miscanthi]